MAIKQYGSKKETEVNYEVLESFGKLEESSKMPKEVRLVSWNGRDAKYDIRPWGTDENGNEKCGKGLTFTAEELTNLLEILKKMDDEESEAE